MEASRPRFPAVESRTKPLTQPSKIWKEKPIILMSVEAAPTASSPVAIVEGGGVGVEGRVKMAGLRGDL